ncbi:MAG: glycine/sarcosine/betaine reductase selenoprotein B family protein [Gemmatimonadota bacterium]
MATFSDLPLKYRLQMAVYRWRRIDDTPWTAPRAPLENARVALVTSAGLYRPDIDPPFRSMAGGDYGFRVLPDDVDLDGLAVGQTSRAFDREPIRRDRNIALPLDRLHRLVEDGVVGQSASRHLSFNGSITAPGRLVGRSGPEMATVLRDDGVDVALLVPI